MPRLRYGLPDDVGCHEGQAAGDGQEAALAFPPGTFAGTMIVQVPVQASRSLLIGTVLVTVVMVIMGVAATGALLMTLVVMTLLLCVRRPLPSDLVAERRDPLGEHRGEDRVIVLDRHGTRRDRHIDVRDARGAPQGGVDLGRARRAVHSGNPVAGALSSHWHGHGPALMAVRQIACLTHDKPLHFDSAGGYIL
jgi:hypothetical protein